MREAIEQSGRQLLVAGKDGDPFGEGEIRRDDGGAALIAVGEQIEEQLAADAVEGHEAQLVDDEYLDAEEPLLEARELAGIPGFHELPHEVRCAGKEHAPFLFRRFDAERDGEVRLPRSRPSIPSTLPPQTASMRRRSTPSRAANGSRAPENLILAGPIGTGKSTVADALMHQEQMMIESLQKKDFAGFKKMVMPGSWSVDEGGAMPIEEFEKVVMDPKANFSFEFKTSDTKVVNIDATTALVTYKLEQKGALMGQPFPPTVYATTIWTNHGGTWMGVFHQESTAAKRQGPGASAHVYCRRVRTVASRPWFQGLWRRQ